MDIMFDYADGEDYDKHSKYKEHGMNTKKSDSDDTMKMRN